MQNTSDESAYLAEIEAKLVAEVDKMVAELASENPPTLDQSGYHSREVLLAWDFLQVDAFWLSLFSAQDSLRREKSEQPACWMAEKRQDGLLLSVRLGRLHRTTVLVPK